jgi:spore coat polysaccharide biosynthesis protein SpsF (cytidylyltransferase family)
VVFTEIEVINLLVTIIVPSVSGAVIITVFVMKELHKVQRRHQQAETVEFPTVNDIRRDFAAYIRCIEGMRQHYQRRLRATTTSDKDREFFGRLIDELEDNLTRYQNELNNLIELISKRRAGMR